MAVRIGISPIAWQNDDLPDLTRNYTMEQALQESRKIGYSGVERGQRMPQDTEGLRIYLENNGLALCGGWCSGGLLARSIEDEKTAMRQQLEQFRALNSPCMVYSECSNTVQGAQDIPLKNRPKLSKDEIAAYAKKLSEVAKWAKDEGMPLAYHHHMGSIIEAEADLDALMDNSSDELSLCFDTGHLAFAGGDVMAVLNRWSHRVLHVHYKDIRKSIVEKTWAEDMSFLDAVIAGAFTVPGDGAIDFLEVTQALKSMDYHGWIVVEAEQDPEKANPYIYSEKGYQHILDCCEKAGLAVQP